MITLPKSRPVLARRLAGAALVGAALATLTATPMAASASGHTCASDDICYYNSANYLADPPTGTGVVNPWGAVSGNYYSLKGDVEPHTYNNPDVCNQAFALTARCDENDTISSMKNKSSNRKVRLFNDIHYSGSYQTVSPLTSLSQVRNNDQISSFCWNDGVSGASLCYF